MESCRAPAEPDSGLHCRQCPFLGAYRQCPQSERSWRHKGRFSETSSPRIRCPARPHRRSETQELLHHDRSTGRGRAQTGLHRCGHRRIPARHATEPFYCRRAGAAFLIEVLTVTYSLVFLALAALAWTVWTFNRLIRNRNRVDEAWAGIDVQLQRRYDLVPNLVSTVKGYVSHESKVLERVTRLRGQPEMALPQRAQQETGLSRSIGRLFALAEDYPELKASDGFRQLHESLVEIEEHLQYARR